MDLIQLFFCLFEAVRKLLSNDQRARIIGGNLITTRTCSI
ncbi:MAG: hypothetical protein ACFC03_02230 [Candidatus Malihini olakiniferum]